MLALGTLGGIKEAAQVSRADLEECTIGPTPFWITLLQDKEEL